MLHFEPKGILASSFRVTRGAREKTTLSLGWLRESGRSVTAASATRWNALAGLRGLHPAHRRSSTRGAVKTSVLRRRFEISCPEGSYVLRARSILRRSYELVEGGRVVGSVEPAGAFTRKGRARLPRELPFETSVFILWLVLLMWQRAERDTG